MSGGARANVLTQQMNGLQAALRRQRGIVSRGRSGATVARSASRPTAFGRVLEKVVIAERCLRSGTSEGRTAAWRLVAQTFQPAGTLVSVPIPDDDQGRPLAIRAQTTDFAAFVTCIVDAVYRVPTSHARFAAEWLEQIEASGDRPLIVDAGANIGASAAMLAIEWPSAHVVAVEPAPENVELLTANGERFPTIDVVAEALGCEDGSLSLVSGRGFDAFRTEANGDGLQVPVSSVTSLVGRSPGTPFFLKVDVEGAEVDVFRDPAAWDFPIIAIEAHDWLFPFEQRLEPFLSGHVSRGRDLLVVGGGVLFSIARPDAQA